MPILVGPIDKLSYIYFTSHREINADSHAVGGHMFLLPRRNEMCDLTTDVCALCCAAFVIYRIT